MPTVPQIVTHFLDLLDSTVTQYLESDSDKSFSIPISAEDFFRNWFPEGHRVFLELSSTNLDDVVITIFSSIAEIMYNLTASSQVLEIAKLCMYSHLAADSINSCDRDIVAEVLSTAFSSLLDQGNLLKFPSTAIPHSHDAIKHYSRLLRTVGTHTDSIMPLLTGRIKSMITTSTDPSRLTTIMRPITCLASNLSTCLAILKQFASCPAQMIPSLAPTISRIVHNIQKYCPGSLPLERDDESALFLFNALPQTSLVARFSLIHFLPSQASNPSIPTAIAQLTAAPTLTQAAETAALAVSVFVGTNTLPPDLSSRAVSRLRAFATTHINSLSPPLSKCLLVDLPVAILSAHPGSRFPSTPSSLSRVISRTPTMMSHANSIADLLSNPLPRQDLRRLLKTLSQNPSLFNAAISRTDAPLLIHRILEECQIEGCDALVSLLSPSNPLVKESLWPVLTAAASATQSLLIAKTDRSPFHSRLPSLAVTLAETTLFAIQTYPTSSEISLTVLYSLETVSLLLLPYPSSSREGVTVLSHVLRSLGEGNLYPSCHMPVDAYQSLVTSCRGRTRPPVASSLRLVKALTRETDTVWKTLYRGFETSDEPATVFAMLLALMPEPKEELLNVVERLVKEGDPMIDVVAPSISPGSVPALISRMLQWTEEIGSAGVIPEVTVMVDGILRILRILLRQPLWEGGGDIGTLVLRLTGYCHLVRESELHSLLIDVAFMVADRDIDDTIRIEIAGKIATWGGKGVAKSIGKLLKGLDLGERVREFVECCMSNRSSLAALFSRNLGKGIENCMGDFLNGGIKERTALLGAVAEVAGNSEPEGNQGKEGILDLLFSGRFGLVEAVIELVPFSRAEAVGVSLMEAAVSRGLGFEFLDYLVGLELRSTQDATRNTLFRGNGVTAKAVGHFPRVYGQAWIEKEVKPIIEKAITLGNEGTGFQVDESRVSPTQDVTVNRANFADFLRSAVASLLSAIPRIPPAIIRASQIIYHRVNERFDGHGLQIVFGFLFLRFILPYFTSPHLLGFPTEISDESRACLVTTSVILMASATRGTLGEKGNHLKQFNEIAVEVHSTFSEAIKSLVRQDLRDAVFEEPTIDVETLTESLSKDLSNVRRQFETKVADLADGDPLREPSEKLLSLIKIPVQSSPRPDVPAVNYEPSAKYLKLMSSDFSGEDFSDINSWFYRDTASHTLAVYYFISENLTISHDLSGIFYHIFTSLSNSQGEFTIIADMAKFNESLIPKISHVMRYINMTPPSISARLKCIAVLNPSPSFLTYLNNNQKHLASYPKVRFIDSQKSLFDSLGNIRLKLGQLAAESLTQTDSIHTAKVNGEKAAVRLHTLSVQFYRHWASVVAPDTFSLTVITFDSITDISELRTDSSFTIKINDGTVFNVHTQEGSNLHALLTTAVNKSRPKNLSGPRVVVTRNSIQWLILNIAFVNLATGEGDVSLNFSAYQLLRSAITSYEVKTNFAPFNCSESTIPKDCKHFVNSLSEDLAKCNGASASAFVGEYFKVIEHLDENRIASTLSYLAPWIEQLPQSEISDKVLEFYFEYTNLHPEFNAKIWSRFGSEELTLRILTKARGRKALRLLGFVSQMNPKTASKFWAEQIIVNDFVVASTILQSLLVSGEFDDEAIPIALKGLLYIRDRPPKENKVAAGRLLHNILVTQALKAKRDITEHVTKTVDLYMQDSPSYTFDSWALNLSELATQLSLIYDALELSDMKEMIFKSFFDDVMNSKGVSKFVGAVVSASFCSHSFDSVSQTIVKDFGFESDDTCTIVCLALSSLRVSKERLPFHVLLGMLLSFVIDGSSPMYLLRSSLSLIKSSDLSFEGLLTKENEEELADLLKFQLNKRPLYSIGVILASKDEKGICNSVFESLSKIVSEPILKVISTSLGYLDANDMQKDFGEDWYAIAATAFAYFMREPTSSSSFACLQALIRMNPKAFGPFNGYSTLFNREIVANITDYRILLELGKISYSPKTKSMLTPLLQKLYDDEFYISPNSVRNILKTLV